MAVPRSLLELLAALLAVQLAAAEFPNFLNEGGPPFVEGPVFEMAPDDPFLTKVLLTGMVSNGSYTFTTTGPDGSVTQIGHYTSWKCGPELNSYLAAVEATIINPDSTIVSRLMCEYGVVDAANVAAGGTNTWTTAEGSCPTSHIDGLLLRYFPTYPEAPNTCSGGFAPAPAGTGDSGAKAPAPSDGALVAGAPSLAADVVAVDAPAPAHAGDDLVVSAPVPTGNSTTQGMDDGDAAPNLDELVPCLMGCLAKDAFKPACVQSKTDPAVPKFVVPNKCAMRCQEKHSGKPGYDKLHSSKLVLVDKEYCKDNAQAIYVQQSIDAPQCMAC